MAGLGWPVAAIYGGTGTAPVVLACEHASAFIPPALAGLGLSAEAQASHIAWDIGARDMAWALSARLDAPLVAGTLSRLVYDCNRPLAAPDCIPARSEIYDVPGNAGLSDAQKNARCLQVHDPFHATLSEVLTQQSERTGQPAALVTIHSFTPVYHGTRRAVEIGYLYHENDRFARAALQATTARGGYQAALNEPYGAQDGVTYTLARHAEARGLDSLMIEIRNDLIDTTAKAEAMADYLHPILTEARA